MIFSSKQQIATQCEDIPPMHCKTLIVAKWPELNTADVEPRNPRDLHDE